MDVAVKMPWSGPSRDEVRAVALDLILRHGSAASVEAMHLAQIASQLGSRENTRLYSRAADYIETYLHKTCEGRGESAKRRH